MAQFWRVEVPSRVYIASVVNRKLMKATTSVEEQAEMPDIKPRCNALYLNGL